MASTMINNDSSAATGVSEGEARIKAIEADIADLESRWPKHSTPPALLMQLDELEQALAEANAALQENSDGE